MLIVHELVSTPALRSLRNLIPNTRRGVRDGLFASGKDWLDEFQKQTLERPKHGRLYGRHRASAPGETAANKTGLYRRSAGWSVSGWTRMTFGNTVFYSAFLELGTSRMEPRPGLQNTERAQQGQTLNNFERGLKRRLLP